MPGASFCLISGSVFLNDRTQNEGHYMDPFWGPRYYFTKEQGPPGGPHFQAPGTDFLSFRQRSPGRGPTLCALAFRTSVSTSISIPISISISIRISMSIRISISISGGISNSIRKSVAVPVSSSVAVSVSVSMPASASI